MKDVKHIFISYAREDRGCVAALARLFEAEGWGVWWDRDNLPPGQQFHKVIDQAIRDAACVLVCWSRAAIDSDWVLDEAVEAKTQDKLFPVLLENVKPPYGFRSYHYVDLIGWNEQGSHEAFQRLQVELARQYYPQISSHEAPARIEEVARFIPRKIQRLIDQLDSTETPPERRLEIGDEFDAMEDGDPRSGVGLDDNGLPDIDWVTIPEGTFIYGEDFRQTEKHLPAFEIARYPVTNLQYQCFIDDGGYDDDRWWQGLEKPEIEKSSWPQGNRPRTNVDWYEVSAFTRWLSSQLGQAIALPHEYQWERAARGSDGLVYPWGSKYRSGYANVNESETNVGPFYLKQTTAVGLYPHGTSPEGILDLCGNVWEWCCNDYDKPDEEIELPAKPALRGGSWYGYPGLARAASRNGYDPDYRYYLIGFRVVRSPPS